MSFDPDRTFVLCGEATTAATVRGAVIEAAPTLRPCAALQAAPGLGIGAVSIYLRALTGAVGSVEVEVRVRYGAAEAEPVASLALPKLTTGSSGGSVLHLSGRRCLGVELWARHDGAAPAQCSVLFVPAPASAGLSWFAEPGSLA